MRLIFNKHSQIEKKIHTIMHTYMWPHTYIHKYTYMTCTYTSSRTYAYVYTSSRLHICLFIDLYNCKNVIFIDNFTSSTYFCRFLFGTVHAQFCTNFNAQVLVWLQISGFFEVFSGEARESQLSMTVKFWSDPRMQISPQIVNCWKPPAVSKLWIAVI